MAALLSIRGLTTIFHCREGQIKACDNVDLDLAPGRTLGLIGETGCGKSVLGMSILRLLPANAVSSGKIIYKNQDLLGLSPEKMRQIRGAEIGLLPQSPSTSLNPVLHVGEQLAGGLRLHRGMNKEEARAAALSLFKSLGLKGFRNRYYEYPHQLSGGMRQRVLATLSIAGKPSLLIADEPTKGLDTVVREQVIELLRQIIRETNASLLLITHDLKVAAGLCDNVAVMYCGEIVENGPAKKVLTCPAHPYTRGLLASLPENGLHPVPGCSPSLLEEIPGCRFYSRCPYKQDACRLQPVINKEVNGTIVRCLNAPQGREPQQGIQQRHFPPQAL